MAADLAQALAKRLKLASIMLSELSEDEVDPETLNLVDEATLRKYMALPLRFEDDSLIIAIADPNDIYALEDLRIIVKHPIKPVVATEEDIQGAFVHLFGTEDHPYTEIDEDESTRTDFGDPEAEPLTDPLLEEELEEPGGDGVVAKNGSGGDDVTPKGSPGGEGKSLPVPLREVSRRRVAVGGGRVGDILLYRVRSTRNNSIRP